MSIRFDKSEYCPRFFLLSRKGADGTEQKKKIAWACWHFWAAITQRRECVKLAVPSYCLLLPAKLPSFPSKLFFFFCGGCPFKPSFCIQNRTKCTLQLFLFRIRKLPQPLHSRVRSSSIKLYWFFFCFSLLLLLLFCELRGLWNLWIQNLHLTINKKKKITKENKIKKRQIDETANLAIIKKKKNRI